MSDRLTQAFLCDTAPGNPETITRSARQVSDLAYDQIVRSQNAKDHYGQKPHFRLSDLSDLSRNTHTRTHEANLSSEHTTVDTTRYDSPLMQQSI